MELAQQFSACVAPKGSRFSNKKKDLMMFTKETEKNTHYLEINQVVLIFLYISLCEAVFGHSVG